MSAPSTLPTWLPPLLRIYPRIAITGGPKAGKSTLAALVKTRPIIHTDDFAKLGWSEASAAVVKHCNELPPYFLVEGVAVPRALRKGLKVDCVIWLVGAHDTLTVPQESMAKACKTVFEEWRGLNPDAIVVIR